MLCGSTAIERPGVSGTPARPSGRAAGRAAAPRGRTRTRGLLHSSLVDALRVQPGPGLDRRPRGLVGAQLALVDQPAADRLVRLVVVAGEGDAHQLAAAVGLGQLQPARALDLQDQRIERVGDVGQRAAAQRRPARPAGCRSAGASSRACVASGRAAARRAGCGSACVGTPRGLDQRLEVAGDQAFGNAVVRLDPVRLQMLLQPGARRGVAGRASRLMRASRADRGPVARRAFAAAQQRRPELAAAVVRPSPADRSSRRRHPARMGAQDGRCGAVARRSRRAGGARAGAGDAGGRQPRRLESQPAGKPGGQDAHVGLVLRSVGAVRAGVDRLVDMFSAAFAGARRGSSATGQRRPDERQRLAPQPARGSRGRCGCGRPAGCRASAARRGTRGRS